MRRFLPVAVAGTAAAALMLCAGCSDTSEAPARDAKRPEKARESTPAVPSADHGATVRAAVETTSRSTARIDEEIEVNGGPAQKYTFTIKGDFDMAADKGNLKVDLQGKQHLDEIFAGGNVYLKGVMPESPELWGSVPRDEPQSHYLLRAPVNDPEHVLRQVAAMRDTKKAGEEKVNGTPTTHYRGTLDFDTLTLRMTSEARAKAAELRDMMGGKLPVQAEAWLDDRGRVARTRLSYVLGTVGSTATMTLSDPGKPVNATPPADKDVVPAASVSGVLPG
ncbi:LppX_LprAFG lipoprotein [Streptomyces roseoverticillatus]|uniref:LppX_LprAFG lipoprotein n=1 Tax=Streptomyces roseoverticillatus TaxID=66429 RepID=UPI001F33769A|nr:LppX_LprAFG lipoprotein [Streptomyces roseoverticillatus]MCF3106445.1 LppX_LprAFG lipoprotein [Streptomyces roseoverticillatus]